MRARRPYHHGDLRGALLHAVGDILREHGVAEVSLREAARRAKVSHSAPAHHFRNKAGLLTAYAAQGYELMAGSALSTLALAPTDGPSRLEALGRGYFRFAVENPEQFDLMFRVELLVPDDPRFRDARAAMFRLMTDVIEQCAREGYLRDRDPRLVLTGAWAIVHGGCNLFLSGRALERAGYGDPERLAADLCRLFADAVLRGRT